MPALASARVTSLRAALQPQPGCASRRRARVAIVGCGDIGLRVLALLRAQPAARRRRVLALTSRAERAPLLRGAGALPLQGDLDQPSTLRRLAALIGAGELLHLAPPPADGGADPRTAHLLQALARQRGLDARRATASAGRQRLVYASTSGVYGDAGGARFDETRTPHPATARARRRVDAERRLRQAGRGGALHVSILRVPGIYALDRPGGDPRERVARGVPVLAAADDVYTNHIHADDLARACMAALRRGAPQRIYHACDDSELLAGDYHDRVADLHGLPRPPRLSRDEAAQRLSPLQLSFLGESRRLDNRRLKRELRLVLRYPSIEQGLRAPAAAGALAGLKPSA